MKIRFLILFLCCIQFSFAQDSVPQDYFESPLDVPLFLAGNFGELRSNHFHSGLDLKTQQRSGLDVKASAEGYVSRVKVSIFGYGNVLYVQHPNGYSTVYAHLMEFSPKIREYLRKHQYDREKNIIDLYPNKEDLPVKAGEVIAKSGKSGSVAGPHVHFEIRDAKLQPMNPLLFGIKIQDHRPPALKGLYVYPQDDKAHVNKSGKRQKLHLIKQNDGSYTTDKLLAQGKIGFGVSALDYMDGVHNTNGLYEIKTTFNGSPKLDLIFDHFSFGNSRYINRYIDYSYFKKHKGPIQKLFLEPNNKIDIQIKEEDKGFITVKDSMDYKFEISLKDFAGNETKIHIPIQGSKISEEEFIPKKIELSDYYAQIEKPNVFDLDYHDIYIPKNALYEGTYLQIKDHPGEIKVHEDNIPLHKDITIGFDISKYSKEDRKKLYVERTFSNGSGYYSPTYKDGDRMTTKTRYFGKYTVKEDTNPPSISPVNFRNKQWISSSPFLKLRIKDNDSGISTYRGTINGEFIVLEYDYKTGIIKYDFRDKVSSETENDLKVIVVDNVGNSSTFTSTFFRKK